MEAPRIARLASADARAYRELSLNAYASDPEAFTATVGERAGLPIEYWQARLYPGADAEEIVIGAFCGGQLAGTVGLRFEQRPKTRHKAWLFGMIVAPALRKRGIGERLVLAALDHARQRSGTLLVQLTVTEGNEPAIALYRRCGFVEFGVEPFAVTSGDGYRAKIHMWRELGRLTSQLPSSPA